MCLRALYGSSIHTMSQVTCKLDGTIHKDAMLGESIVNCPFLLIFLSHRFLRFNKVGILLYWQLLSSAAHVLSRDYSLTGVTVPVEKRSLWCLWCYPLFYQTIVVLMGVRNKSRFLWLCSVTSVLNTRITGLLFEEIVVTTFRVIDDFIWPHEPQWTS